MEHELLHELHFLEASCKYNRIMDFKLYYNMATKNSHHLSSIKYNVTFSLHIHVGFNNSPKVTINGQICFRKGIFMK